MAYTRSGERWNAKGGMENIGREIKIGGWKRERVIGGLGVSTLSAMHRCFN